METQAAIGAVIVLLLLVFLGIGLMRANVITGAFIRTLQRNVRTRFLVVLGAVGIFVLLLYGIAEFGMVNPLAGEQHIERNRQTNRLVITEDKDGCLDLRTLGRSNGVYMAVQPCKPGDKKQPQTPPAQQQQQQQQ
jgi:hypothetical protein